MYSADFCRFKFSIKSRNNKDKKDKYLFEIRNRKYVMFDMCIDIVQTMFWNFLEKQSIFEQFHFKSNF